MNFSISSIIAGIFFSIIGIWIFRVGKKEGHFMLMLIGVTLITYTYFTSSPWVDWGAGLLLCGGAYYYYRSN